MLACLDAANLPTATLAIKELAKLITNDFKITGVPSSESTKELAISLGIPLLELGEVSSIDISIDGADEFTKDLNLIKGGGGALFREKIVASLSKKKIIITDGSKLVKKLGAFTVPIEVNANAAAYVTAQLQKLNGKPVKRMKANTAFTTDNTLSISGSFKGLPYRVSAGYLDQQGVVIKSDLKRATGALTLSPRLFTDHLKIDLTVKGSLTESQYPNDSVFIFH
ncbi:MAG: ribose 5-phosphate isomerase A, partial [Pedobacter sp.]